VKPADLLALLQSFHSDKLALYRGHEAGALRVSGYEFNNTYQYVLQREDTHLSWLRDALIGAGAQPDDGGTAPAIPAPGKGARAARALFDEDAQMSADFVARWGSRVEAVTNARHRKMLELMLGEAAEHQRFFEQAASGRIDLLGRRPERAGTGGGVLPNRWIG
jgi:hypothetical protein